MAAAGEYVDGSIWFYAPNKVLPVIWAFLFAFSFIMHTWQCFHFTAWKATALLPFSTLIFVAAYIMREIGAFHVGDLGYYIAHVCLVYGAPPLYELASYIILGRILYYVPYYSPLNPGRVITTFGFLSAIVETLNGTGASMISNFDIPEYKQKIGHNLLRAGLAIQLGVLVSFVSLAVYFQRKCARHGLMPAHLRSVLTTLYISTAIVAIRTIYRTVEYFAASQIHPTPDFDPMSINPIIRYEWFFWVFEATLMLSNSLLLNFRHPAMYLPKSNKIYLAKDGVTEILGPGFEDQRIWLMTLFDPWDLLGLLRGRDKQERYWETHERVLPNGPVALIGVEMKREEVIEKTTPWTLFKMAFLADRGHQGKELHRGIKGTDVEKNAGRNV